MKHLDSTIECIADLLENVPIEDVRNDVSILLTDLCALDAIFVAAEVVTCERCCDLDLAEALFNDPMMHLEVAATECIKLVRKGAVADVVTSFAQNGDILTACATISVMECIAPGIAMQIPSQCQKVFDSPESIGGGV